MPYLACLEICDFLSKMSDALRPDDPNADVVTTGLVEGLGGSDAPLMRAFIFHPKTREAQRSGEILEECPLVSYHLAHDAAVCH